MKNEGNHLIEDISKEIKAGALEIIEEAGHGHVGASMSSSDLITALYFDVMDYDIEEPNHEKRDRVLIRGHVGPLRYKLFSLLEWLDDGDLETYRQYPTKLKGHECMNHVEGVDISPSGSLGMMLSFGIGSQIAANNQDYNFNTYVFLGDGEEQEGNVSEAARHASSLDNMENIIAILDKNKKQLSCHTKEVDGGDVKDIWEGYGWNVYEIEDGHDLEEISNTLKMAREDPTPSILIANTVKGKEVSGHDDDPTGYHTSSTCDWEEIRNAIDRIRSEIYTDNIKRKAFEIVSDFDLGSRADSEDLSKDINIKSNSEKSNSLDYAQAEYFKELDDLIGNEDVDFYFMHADWVRKDLANMAGIGNNIQEINV